MSAWRSDRRLRLLVLTSTFPRWDGDATPRFVADLCVSLSKTMDVTVLAPASDGAKVYERSSGIDVHRFRYAWPSRAQSLADGAILPNIQRNRWLLAQVPPLVLGELWAAWRLMRLKRFDVIHAHWVVPQGLIAALLKLRFGVPIVTTTHGGDLYALRGKAAARTKQFALSKSDVITAVSSALKDEVAALGIGDRRVDVLPMGVDTTRFTPDARSEALRRSLNPDGPLLLFVGRLVEKKGPRYAIEAMVGITKEQENARLVVVGEGPDAGSLRKLALDLGVGSSVAFLGSVPNAELPMYYASADVLLAPSIVARNGDQEGAPVVLAEAMASGCPVVAAELDGVRDTVIDGSTGLIVPARDPYALSLAASGLLSDEPRRGQMARRSVVEAAERLSHTVIHSSYATLIEQTAA
jgi:glycosyltransferase involved in cell wall biosynthesis